MYVYLQHHINVRSDHPLPSRQHQFFEVLLLPGVEGTRLGGSSKHHGELTTDLPQILLCICVTPDTLDNADYRALWGTGHHF